MFLLSDIKAAHSKVKSGADFTGYIKDLITIGVKEFDNFVIDGHVVYFGENNFQVQSGSKYAALDIANQSDIPLFQHYLKIYQAGQTDYPAFCKHAAATGVHKWAVNTDLMTCTNYDTSHGSMLVEQIPGS